MIFGWNSNNPYLFYIIPQQGLGNFSKKTTTNEFIAYLYIAIIPDQKIRQHDPHKDKYQHKYQPNTKGTSRNSPRQRERPRRNTHNHKINHPSHQSSELKYLRLSL